MLQKSCSSLTFYLPLLTSQLAAIAVTDSEALVDEAMLIQRRGRVLVYEGGVTECWMPGGVVEAALCV